MGYKICHSYADHIDHTLFRSDLWADVHYLAMTFELAQRLWPVYHFYTAAHAYTMQVIL